MVLLLFSAGKNVKGIKHDVSLFCQVWYSGSSKHVFINNYSHASLFSEQKSVQRVVFLFFSPWMGSSRKKLDVISCLMACFPIIFLILQRKEVSFFQKEKEARRKHGRKDRRKMFWNWGDLSIIQGTQNYCNVNTFVPYTHQSPLPTLSAVPDLNSTYLHALGLFHDP